MRRIRTIGMYQPYASLMLHGKIETRWIKKGKKPPFPLGEYLIYSTKARYLIGDFFNIAGPVQFDRAKEILKKETETPSNRAICLGTLVEVRPMTVIDEDRCFVRYTESEDKILWCLVFEDIQRIYPFEFTNGHQGIGFLTEEDYSRIKIIY